MRSERVRMSSVGGVMRRLAACVLGIGMIGAVLLSGSIRQTADRSFMVTEVKAANIDPSRVLFISSYSYAWDTVQIQIEGIKEGLSEDTSIDYEFMDTKRFPENENIQMFYEGLAYRMSKVEPYDAVIVGDDVALRFAMEHRSDIFKGIPIIFEGINDLSYAARVAKDPYVTGIVEALSIKENIDFARKLYPEAKRVVAILDDSVTGQAERKSFYSNAKVYPDLEFTEINCSALTTKELIDSLKSIEENTILIYIVMTEDASGKQYNSHESIDLVSEYATVPALRMVSGGIGEGLLGGNIVSMELSGKIAAQMADAITHGKNPADYDIVIDSPNVFCIDEAVMRRFGLELSLIPKGAEIINHQPTFFEKYQGILIPLAVIILVLVAMIAFLCRFNFKAILLTKSLNRQKDQLEYESTYDFLTGLANRSKLYADLGAIERANGTCAIFMFDIDGFKRINDTYGHNIGDEVLAELGRRISCVKEKGFTPYRLAGDEFVCIYKTFDEEAIERCAKQCMELFRPEFKLESVTLEVNISMGISVCPGDGTNMVKLLEHADKALYVVKRNGKNDYAWFRNIKDKL